jgi:hypothetical protein
MVAQNSWMGHSTSQIPPAADSLYGHLKMVESTVLETMKEFASTVINVYGNEYLRPPFFR